MPSVSDFCQHFIHSLFCPIFSYFSPKKLNNPADYKLRKWKDFCHLRMPSFMTIECRLSYFRTPNYHISASFRFPILRVLASLIHSKFKFISSFTFFFYVRRRGHKDGKKVYVPYQFITN